MTISEDMVLRAQATYEVAFHEHADTPAGRNAMMRAALTAALGDAVVVPREPPRDLWAEVADAVVRNSNVHHDIVVQAIFAAITTYSVTRHDLCTPSEGA